MNNFSVVSLFAGCGGLDLGFRGDFTSLGKYFPKRLFETVWANELINDFCQTYETNLGHPIICDDINNVLHSPYHFYPLPEKADIVLGGFPCQDFSHAGKRRGFNNEKRGLLYQSMMEVIRRTKPMLFVAENVKGLLTLNNGEAIKTVVNDFKGLGYQVTYKLYLAANYGVPQMRERVIIVGTKKDILPAFKHDDTIAYEQSSWITTKQAIGDLEHVSEGEILNHYWSKAKKNKGQGNGLISPDKPGPTMRAEHHGNIEWHWNGLRRLSAREAARLQTFPDDFKFLPSTSSAYKQIGNAVPPVLAWHIATAIEKFLLKNLSNKSRQVFNKVISEKALV